jgi:peptidoglycan hydrolase-like protein with peptidoglycan-binding domain
MLGKWEHKDLKQNLSETNLEEGMRGSDVAKLQYMLNFIAMFYPMVPFVSENGIYDEKTTSSVRNFEILSGLVVDGRAGRLTWQALFDAYNGILQNVDIPEPPSGLRPNEYPYPGFQMQIGSQGEYVKILQRVLQQLSSYYPQIPRIAEDGDFGSVTRNSVSEFQSIVGLTPDGIVGPDVWNELMDRYVSILDRGKITPYPGTDLSAGSSGYNVRLIQTALNSIAQVENIPGVTVNGEFDDKTREAVSAIQKHHDLYVDGVVDPVTWEVIMNAYYNSANSNSAKQYNQSVNPANPASAASSVNEAQIDVTPGGANSIGTSAATPGGSGVNGNASRAEAATDSNAGSGASSAQVNSFNSFTTPYNSAQTLNNDISDPVFNYNPFGNTAAYNNNAPSSYSGFTSGSISNESDGEAGFSLDDYSNEYPSDSAFGDTGNVTAKTIELESDTAANDASLRYGSPDMEIFNGGGSGNSTITNSGFTTGNDYIGPGYAGYGASRQYGQPQYNALVNQQVAQAGYPVYNGNGAYTSPANDYYTPTYQAVPYDSGNSATYSNGTLATGYVSGVSYYPSFATDTAQSTALTTSVYVTRAVSAVSRTVLFLYLLKLLQEQKNCYC